MVWGPSGPDNPMRQEGSKGHAGLWCKRALRSIALLLAFLAPARPTHAQQTLTWSPAGVADSGGTGTWNTVGAVWANGAACCQPWSNAASPVDNALFGGAAGTVTVGGAIRVHNITFSTSGYTLTGGTLTLEGVTPSITANGVVVATILYGVGGFGWPE